jgi:hypothetical protein
MFGEPSRRPTTSRWIEYITDTFDDDRASFTMEPDASHQPPAPCDLAAATQEPDDAIDNDPNG